MAVSFDERNLPSYRGKRQRAAGGLNRVRVTADGRVVVRCGADTRDRARCCSDERMPARQPA
ncbi:hypothetical protein, partial [Burkholderia anthinoferrum]